MQSCVQNITTVRYLLDLYELTLWRHPQKVVTPFMPTPSLSHCKHWSTSPKSI